MENQSQVCLGRSVVHGVTCECHKLSELCFCLFVAGLGFAGTTGLGLLSV